MRTLELRYGDGAAMRIDHEKNLSVSRAFVVGASGFADREACELAVIHPVSGGAFAVKAEVVWIAPNGVGLALVGMDAGKKAELAAFVAEEVKGEGQEGEGQEQEQGREGEGQEQEQGREGEGREGEGTEEERAAANVHARVRGLSSRERDEMARRGTMPERVALERAYGGAVWEGLLQNPGLTAIEVARMARNGALPRPLVSVIVANSAWLVSGEVQRALLSNPRCGGAHLEKVLSAMKPADLARLAHQCPYRQEVRAAALRRAKT